ncbi:hypothetical protein J7L00_06155 [Candidatus Bathyarchaeota archaeon]|nr:hypothetical protein [Candidatus Bathyarchaeota archaeon]
MSVDKKKVEDLLGRIDELLRILRFLMDDLSEISNTLKASLGSYTVAQEASLPESSGSRISIQSSIVSETSQLPRSQEEEITIEKVQDLFPPDLANLLYFEDAGEYIIVKPRQYLGPDNFRRIASIVRDQMSGEYISAGRDSHFRIPKT